MSLAPSGVLFAVRDAPTAGVLTLNGMLRHERAWPREPSGPGRLLPPQVHPYEHGKSPRPPNLPGGRVVGAMRGLSGGTPWQPTPHAMNLIGSHDTHRVASLLGASHLVDVASEMLAAHPGVPTIYAGDELGLRAMGPECARLPMPWAHPERWDGRRGGPRWLHVGNGSLTFLREAPGETVLVHAVRADHPPGQLPVAVVGPGLTGPAGTADLRAGEGGPVTLPAAGPAFGMWRLGEGEGRDTS